MRLEPGMRVRCVDAHGFYGPVGLVQGGEYRITRTNVGGSFVNVEGLIGNYLPKRFKPVIRVKAKCVPSLDLLIKRAVAAVEAMTPAEKGLYR